MILSDLKIHHLRNITSAHLELNPGFNFIVGPNGSGKTAILEALYLLSCGHSFRSREHLPLISHGETLLTVFARSETNDSISIQKSTSVPTLIKLNNQPCNSTSQLAYALPSQVLYADIFHIVDAGPAERRSLLDWGLFHVKQEYLALWKTYKKVLKQRNSLLKTQASYNQFLPWDIQLDRLANELHSLRVEYFQEWMTAFYKLLPLLTTISCQLHYYKGWDRRDEGKSLLDLLQENFISDKQKTYTQQGAHQADLLIQTPTSKAKHHLSRGQQKIVLIALKLSQRSLLGKASLCLIDDFSAELDEFHQNTLLQYLQSVPGQYIITSPACSDLTSRLDKGSYSSFHLDKGSVVAKQSLAPTVPVFL
jgi:DNA replication and repair protein RecF